MKKQIIAGLMVVALLASTLSLTGCSSQTTFNYIGVGFEQGAFAFKAQIDSLRLAGKTDPEKIVRLERLADSLTLVATATKIYINELAGISGANKAEVIRKLADALDRLSGILQNPDVANLGANSIPVQILVYVGIALRAGSAAIQRVKDPVSITGNQPRIVGPGTPTSKIIVRLPPPPKGIEPFFKPVK